MPVLLLMAAFLGALIVARIVRFATGLWVPGWIGGLSLLALFALFAVVAVAAGAPSWLETAFFVVVGLHVGTFMSLARLKLSGRWWEFWR